MSSTIRQFENAVNLLIAGARAGGISSSALAKALDRVSFSDNDVYRTRNDVIVSPGKFEGEPIYSPYFWKRALDGAGDYDPQNEGFDNAPYRLRIVPDDIERWPALRGAMFIWLQEDDNGFVTTWLEG